MKIELDRVSKHFVHREGGGRRDVLKDISLTVRVGDSLAIIGPSGSGKSTLLNMIGALDRPSQGVVRFNGQDVWEMSEPRLAEFRNNHIGFVFQLHHLLPQLTVLENVLLPLIPSKKGIAGTDGRTKALGLLQRVGLEQHVHKRPGQLSVGECQRAAVVRALINEPDFILADEPTGSLDSRSAENLGEILSALGHEHKVAVIVVTHSEKLAAKMKTVWYLEDGTLTVQK